MPPTNAAKPGLDSLDLNTLPEHTRDQILHFLESNSHRQSRDNESGSSTGQRNGQRSNTNASSSKNARPHSPEVHRHRQPSISDYDMPLPSPSTTLSWSVMDLLNPPPTLQTNVFQPYPPPPEEAPSGSPVLGLVTRPAALARPPPLARPPGTPVVSSTDLPLIQGPTPSRASVPLPAIEAVRPTPYHRSISVIPSNLVTKRKSIVEDVGATKRQRTKGGKAVVVPSSVLPLEDEEDISSLTDTIQEFKRGIGLPFPFVDVQGGLGGELGVALEALGKYVEGRFNEVAKLAEKIDAKLATMAIRAADSKSKAKRKVAKLDRTADDDHAYTYIKGVAHAVIQETLAWKPSDGPATLPERGEEHQNEDGNNNEAHLPDWDDRVDSPINKSWVEQMSAIVAGRIEGELAGDTKSARFLQNVDIDEMSKEHVKEYFRHLKSTRKKGPERVQRDKRRQRRFARTRDASRQATRALVMLNDRLENAAATLRVGPIPTLKPIHFPVEVFSDEESGPEDVEDEVASKFASYGAPYALPVGGFILRRPKPYLSPSMKKLTAFVRDLYKWQHGKPFITQKRITGPLSTNLPTDLQLEAWMLDPKWEPPQDRVNLVRLSSTITDERQFARVIDCAMKRWADDHLPLW